MTGEGNAKNRDTQFQGFAHALLQEMLETDLGYTRTIYWREGMEKIIARRAYDLVEHVCQKLNPLEGDGTPCHIQLMFAIHSIGIWEELKDQIKLLKYQI